MPDNPKFHRRISVGADKVCGAQGVSVHRRVIKRWDVDRGDQRLRQHLPERLQERHVYGGEGCKKGQNSLKRLFYIQHLCVVVVAMGSFVGVFLVHMKFRVVCGRRCVRRLGPVYSHHGP